MIPVAIHGRAITFNIHVAPRASQAMIIGPHQDGLKIKLTAPPVDGAANRQCIQLLAKSLGVAKSAISIEAGNTSRRKRIRIDCRTRGWTTPQIKALAKKVSRLGEKSV